MKVRLVAVLALLAISPPVGAREAAAADPPPHLAADRGILRQAMLDQRVETGQPRPGISLYVRDLGVALNRWMADLLDFLRPRFSRLGPLAEPLLRLLLVLLIGGLLAFTALFALRRWRDRAQPRALLSVRQLDEAPVQPAASAPYWADELRRRLDDRDGSAAIEALWWWLAGRLVGDRAEASWTSRELITRARRRDLAPGVRRLDRMIYGSERPETGDVRQLWNDLQDAVG